MGFDLPDNPASAKLKMAIQNDDTRDLAKELQACQDELAEKMRNFARDRAWRKSILSLNSSLTAENGGLRMQVFDLRKQVKAGAEREQAAAEREKALWAQIATYAHMAALLQRTNAAASP